MTRKVKFHYIQFGKLNEHFLEGEFHDFGLESSPLGIVSVGLIELPDGKLISLRIGEFDFMDANVLQSKKLIQKEAHLWLRNTLLVFVADMEKAIEKAKNTKPHIGEDFINENCNR